MSITFIVAQVSYVKGCPEVVKRFSSFGEYRAEYAGPSQLLRFADHVLARGNITEFRIFYRDIIQLSGTHLKDPAFGLADNDKMTVKTKEKLRERLKSAVGGTKGTEQAYSDMLDCLLELERKTNRHIFGFSIAFFGVGLILFGVVLLQNMYFTIRLFF